MRATTTRFPIGHCFVALSLLAFITLFGYDGFYSSRSVVFHHQKDGLFSAGESGTLQQQVPSSGIKFEASKSTRGRRRLILHVGPSKTATTTLQTDLTTFHDAELLRADNYHYAGRYYRPYINNDGELKGNRSESALITTAHNMMKRCDLVPRSGCCDFFVKRLDAFRKRHPDSNLILSEEPFGNQWQQPEDYLAIREAVKNHWDVTIVVAYRRFYEWIPSTRFQQDRLDRPSQTKDVWPGEGAGRAIVPLFPTWYSQWGRCCFTDSILDSVGDTFPMKILNLHDHDDGHKSPLTIFLCDLLGTEEVPNSCARSQERDHNATASETVMNSHTRVPSFYYDALATAAAAQGLVNTTAWKRPNVRAAIQAYHEHDRNLTATDLDLVCPSERQLADFLDESLQKERKYLPDFFDENEHREAFAQAFDQQKGIYCWVNTTAVLEQEEWQHFFTQLQSAVPDEGGPV